MGETENERIARIVDERLEEALMGISVPAPQTAPQPVTTAQPVPLKEVLTEVLNEIDPTDSDSALLMFEWLKRNARLHKAATLNLQGASGYLYLYQEPKGATREGWTDGGTAGDRMVDDALEKAEETGMKAKRGLCPKCFSAVKIENGSSRPVLENEEPGEDPAVCSAGGDHELRGAG